MADKKGGKGKSEKKAKPISSLYENGKVKNRSCPKCGPGVFLANHKDRLTCGRCGFMEKK